MKEKDEKTHKRQTELFYSRMFAIEQIVFLFFLIFAISYISVNLPNKSEEVPDLFVLWMVILIVINFALFIIYIVMLLKSIVIYTIKIKKIGTKENKKMCLRLIFFPIFFAFYYKYYDFNYKDSG